MNKKRILCFGDSNTWGYIPVKYTGTQPIRRYPDHIRWTGVLQSLLGETYSIIEEGLNGRTTSLEDPIRPGRNGLDYLKPCLESHHPLDFIIFMLGTNDLKKIFSPSPESISMRMGTLIDACRTYEEKFTQHYAHQNLKIVLLSPTILKQEFMSELSFYDTISENSELLGHAYKELARTKNLSFLDISKRIEVSSVDGSHFDEPTHLKLGQIIFEWISALKS